MSRVINLTERKKRHEAARRVRMIRGFMKAGVSRDDAETLADDRIARNNWLGIRRAMSERALKEALGPKLYNSLVSLMEGR